jgi:hypothetical protein
MIKHSYKIGNLTYYQTELTWEQDKKLIDLAKKAQVKLTANDKLTIGEIPGILSKHDLLSAFLSHVLKPKRGISYLWDRIKRALRGNFERVSVNKATNTQIEKIFQDFFLLNRMLIERLSGVGELFSQIAGTGTEPKPKPTTAAKSSTTTISKEPKNTKTSKRKSPAKSPNTTLVPGT